MKILRKYLHKSLVACLILPLFYTGNAFSAADVVLRGNVTEQTCVVSADSDNFSVALGDWSLRSLIGAAGNVSPESAFSIQLANCPAVAITIIFTGTPAEGSSELLAIAGGNDSAKNVAIELLDRDMTRLGLSKASKPVTADENGNATFNFYARYISTASQVSAGQAHSSSVFTLNYD